jgi:hypothetical protein
MSLGGVNPGNDNDLDSSLAVFVAKRGNHQVQRFLGIVFAGYREHAGIDQRFELGGQSES